MFEQGYNVREQVFGKTNVLEPIVVKVGRETTCKAVELG
jgi:hypothetical protein